MSTFQFYCPNGHLLQGHESQQGQQSQCPMCGAMFMVPVVNPGAAPQQQQPNPQQQFNSAPQQQQAPPQQPAPPPEPAKPPEPKILHIPCPNGHMLETPDDILGQQALCPYCNVQFELRYEDSHEARQERENERRRREQEMNDCWVKYAIRAAIGVGIMFGLMVLWFIVKKFVMDTYYPEESAKSAFWGPIVCGVLTIIIMLIAFRSRGKKKGAAAS